MTPSDNHKNIKIGHHTLLRNRTVRVNLDSSLHDNNDICTGNPSNFRNELGYNSEYNDRSAAHYALQEQNMVYNGSYTFITKIPSHKHVKIDLQVEDDDEIWEENKLAVDFFYSANLKVIGELENDAWLYE